MSAVTPNRPFKVVKGDFYETGDYHAPGYHLGTIVISTKVPNLYRISGTSYCYTLNPEQLEPFSIDDLEKDALMGLISAETVKSWEQYLQAWKIVFSDEKAEEVRVGSYLSIQGEVFGLVSRYSSYFILEKTDGSGQRSSIRNDDPSIVRIYGAPDGSLARWGISQRGLRHLNFNQLRCVFEIFSQTPLKKDIILRDHKGFSLGWKEHDDAVLSWSTGTGSFLFFKKTDEVTPDGVYVYQEVTTPVDLSAELAKEQKLVQAISAMIDDLKSKESPRSAFA